MEYLKEKTEQLFTKESPYAGQFTTVKTKPMYATGEEFEKLKGYERQTAKITCTSVYKPHPTKRMKAVCFKGAAKCEVDDVPAPTITDPEDVIVKMTSMTLCGSDLHMYLDMIPGPPGVMQKGDILGHEGCGVVEEVGPNCTKGWKVGDRVSVSAAICCGFCEYCKAEKWSLCDNTNPSLELEAMYGARLAGIFGYSHLTGGYAGMFAEYVRVPYGDVNLMRLPMEGKERGNMINEDVAPMLSDTALTGFFGTELAHVEEGRSVVVYGAGPIGLMAAYSSVAKGAKPVIIVDSEQYRLDVAAKIGAITVNRAALPSGRTVEKEIKSKYLPAGPDCSIDCTGFRFGSGGIKEKIEKITATDAVDMVAELIHMGKKGGNIALIGDYFGTCNQFPIGALMEKGFTTRGGQIFVHHYRGAMMKWIQDKKLDPAFMITHRFPLEQAAKGYDLFANRKDGAIKVVLRTQYGEQMAAKWGISNPEAARKPPQKLSKPEYQPLGEGQILETHVPEGSAATKRM